MIKKIKSFRLSPFYIQLLQDLQQQEAQSGKSVSQADLLEQALDLLAENKMKESEHNEDRRND